MNKKIYTVRLIVTEENGEITAGVVVDLDKKVDTIWGAFFASYLKDVSCEHAPAIIKSAKNIQRRNNVHYQFR